VNTHRKTHLEINFIYLGNKKEIHCIFKTYCIISVLFSTKCCLFYLFFCSNNMFFITMCKNLNTDPSKIKVKYRDSLDDIY